MKLINGMKVILLKKYCADEDEERQIFEMENCTENGNQGWAAIENTTLGHFIYASQAKELKC